jgi:hypothetical protein
MIIYSNITGTYASGSWGIYKLDATDSTMGTGITQYSDGSVSYNFSAPEPSVAEEPTTKVPIRYWSKVVKTKPLISRFSGRPFKPQVRAQKREGLGIKNWCKHE